MSRSICSAFAGAHRMIDETLLDIISDSPARETCQAGKLVNVESSVWLIHGTLLNSETVIVNCR